MKELEALKASIERIWGEIPSEIAGEIADLEKFLSPKEVVSSPEVEEKEIA